MNAVARSYTVEASVPLPIHGARTWWKYWVAFCLLSSGFIFMATYRLTSFPQPDSDESWDEIPAYTLLNEGALRNPVLAGREHYDEHVVRPRLTLTLLVAGAFKLLGTGLWQGRLVAVLFGGLTLLATWWYARAFLSLPLALIASAILATDPSMLQMSRLIRPEIVEAALIMIGLFSLTRGLETRHTSDFVVAGVLAGIGLYTHAAMVFIAAAFVVLFPVHWGPACVRRRHVWIFLAAMSVGLLPYLVYLFVQDAGSHFEDFRAQLSQHGRAVLDTQGWWWLNLEAAFRRYHDFIGSPFGVLPFVLGVAGLVAGGISRNRYIKDLAIVVVVYSIGIALFVHEAMPAYLMPIAPLMAILVANLLVTLSTTSVGSRTWRRVGVALACVLFVNQAGRIGTWVWKYRHLDFTAYGTRLEAAIQPTDKVWAPLELWPIFRDHDLRSEFTNLMEFPEGTNGAPVDVKRVTFRPDIVILPEHAQYPASHERMRRIAAALGASTARSFEDPYYGRTDILRLHWPAGVAESLH